MSDKNKLYNEAQKLRYINKKESEVTLAPNFLNNLFTKSALFEEKYGKDLCQWTVDEIIAFYKFSDSRSLDSLTLINSNYAMYTNWCLSETLVPDGQNHFLEINGDMLNDCVNGVLLESTVITRKELEQYVDKLPNYQDRFIFYALFEGICGKMYEEITSIRPSHINGNKITLCTGRELKITSKLKEVIESATNEEAYQSYQEGGRVIKFPEEEDGRAFKIIKVMSNQNLANDIKNRGQILGRRYTNALDYMGLSPQMTPKRLIMSGKIEYIKKLMAEENLSLEEVIKQHADDINSKYTVERFKGTWLPFIRKYEKFFEEDRS